MAHPCFLSFVVHRWYFDGVELCSERSMPCFCARVQEAVVVAYRKCAALFPEMVVVNIS